MYKYRMVRNLMRKYFRLLFPILIAAIFILGCTDDPKVVDTKTVVFNRLQKIRIKMKNSIEKYFADVHQTAIATSADSTLIHYFRKMLSFYSGQKNPEYQLQIEYEIDVHYVNHYGDFYDLLFVDSSGFVFHSIRQEPDYHSNLLTGDYKDSRLAGSLNDDTLVAFTDYEIYSPSGEPASFFIVPIRKDTRLQGWIIMQYAINKINNLLTDRRGLGRSGEVYLVNKDRLMISESRFVKDETILKRKIVTEAVKTAFKEGSGNRLIKDYRGVNVFSSFERFNMFGSPWIIIAEIDEDEIISELYKSDAQRYITNMVSRISSSDRKESDAPLSSDDEIMVDINEFAHAEPGQRLLTKGVSTCTAVAISFEGRFAYLVHLSPIDIAYDRVRSDNLPLALQSDFLGRVIEKIRHFEIYPSELHNLAVTIIANHDKTIGSIVDRLLANSMELSQIKFMYNPDASLANVTVNDTGVTVQWVSNEQKRRIQIENNSTVKNLGEILKTIVDY